jgi:hypothetical protein
MEETTGGAAFPQNAYVKQDGELEVAGMTLRDYFAAKAMQGLLATETFCERDDREIAKFAYGQADAMLAARKQ